MFMKVKLVTGWNGLSRKVVDWRITGFFRNIHKDWQKENWSAYRRSFQTYFSFQWFLFSLMWYKSPHTQMCKCCHRKWLCHCQGPGCLGRANVAISLLCSGQKECRYLHGQSFLRNIVVLKTYQTAYIINSCFSYILGLNGAFLAL